MPKQNTSAPQPISLMAAGELRDALTAIEEGKGPTAVAALMAIDPASWQAIEQRLAAVVGTDLRTLLLKVAGEDDVAVPAIG
ncbi:hypothetical protein [Streptomyces sp. NPDC046261]|uniref:hypothetical protein n=1 Tax=Streptomyces sp. NPDC046261 TaxID=3157200 RepID=UPI0033D697C5